MPKILTCYAQNTNLLCPNTNFLHTPQKVTRCWHLKILKPYFFTPCTTNMTFNFRVLTWKWYHFNPSNVLYFVVGVSTSSFFSYFYTFVAYFYTCLAYFYAFLAYFYACLAYFYTFLVYFYAFLVYFYAFVHTNFGARSTYFLHSNTNFLHPNTNCCCIK